jgi:hypothetical protein
MNNSGHGTRVGSAPSEHEEKARELLAQMRLLEVARGNRGLWNWHAGDRLFLLSFTAIVLVLYHNFVEDGFQVWMLLMLPVLLFAGLRPSALGTNARVDALLEFLERSGRLGAVDARSDDG